MFLINDEQNLRNNNRLLMETMGIEPTTSWLQTTSGKMTISRFLKKD